MSRLIPGVIGLVLLSAFPVRSETVDLAAALKAAVAERPTAEAARQRTRAARAAAGEARSGYLPQVSFSETFRATDQPAASLFMRLNQERLKLYQTADPYNNPDTTSDFETRVDLEQALYNPDLAYGLERARTGFRAAGAASRWTSEQAAFDAFRAYLQVQQAAAALDWVDSSLREAEEIQRLARQREAAGTGLKADTLRARVAMAEAERRRLSAVNDLRLARRRLALAMGREDGEVDIARPLTVKDLPAAPVAAPQPRADLRAARLQAEAAAVEGRRARAQYLPRLGLNGAYIRHDHSTPLGGEGDAWQVGVGLSWDIFTGLRRHWQIERAAAEQRSAALEAEDLGRSIALQRQEAALRAEEARLQLASARNARTEAAEGHRLLLQRYEAGLTDLSGLLGARAALDRARFAAVAARTRMLLALGNLRLQQGIFLQSMLPAEEDSL